MSGVKLFFAGDFCAKPSTSIIQVSDELRDLVQSCDLRVVNFEVPLRPNIKLPYQKFERFWQHDDVPDFLRNKPILSEDNTVYDYSSLLNLEKMSLRNDCVIAHFELKNLTRDQFSNIIEHDIAVVHHIRTIAERDRLLALVDGL